MLAAVGSLFCLRFRKPREKWGPSMFEPALASWVAADRMKARVITKRFSRGIYVHVRETDNSFDYDAAKCDGEKVFMAFAAHTGEGWVDSYVEDPDCRGTILVTRDAMSRAGKMVHTKRLYGHVQLRETATGRWIS